MTTLDTHNQDLAGIIPDAGPVESPQEQQEWESTPEVQEIEYHVPIVQLNTPPAARNGIHYTVQASTSLNPVQLLMGRDYDRVKAYITAVDYPVVIAQSEPQAQSALNSAANTSTGITTLYTNVSGGTGPTLTATGQSSIISGLGAYTNLTLVGAPVGAITGTTPTLTLAIDGFDPNGNGVFMGGPPEFTASTPYAQSVMIGPGGNANAVLPTATAQITWTITGTTPSFANFQISLYAHSSVLTGPSTPSGQLLPVGVAMPIEHCDEVWLAATSANTGRVSVEVCRTERASA